MAAVILRYCKSTSLKTTLSQGDGTPARAVNPLRDAFLLQAHGDAGGGAALRCQTALPSRPSWPLYKNLMSFVRKVRGDISDMRPRDMIDMQSFLWVQGSEEFPD
jgi:hypothetical protein